MEKWIVSHRVAGGCPGPNLRHYRAPVFRLTPSTLFAHDRLLLQTYARFYCLECGTFASSISTKVSTECLLTILIALCGGSFGRDKQNSFRPSNEFCHARSAGVARDDVAGGARRSRTFQASTLYPRSHRPDGLYRCGFAHDYHFDRFFYRSGAYPPDFSNFEILWSAGPDWLPGRSFVNTRIGPSPDCSDGGRSRWICDLR